MHIGAEFVSHECLNKCNSKQYVEAYVTLGKRCSMIYVSEQTKKTKQTAASILDTNELIKESGMEIPKEIRRRNFHSRSRVW